MNGSKKDIRAEMRRRAAEFKDASGTEGMAAADESIWQQVEARPEFSAATRILIYMSIPGEVQTRDFIARWCDRKQFVLPLVCGDRLELRLYGRNLLVAGYRGIEEPSANAPLVNPEDVDLALIPGMAFARTASGVLRMGRGGGFYDRLLPHLTCPTIGVCYSFRLLESIPTDPWDIPLTDVICQRSV